MRGNLVRIMLFDIFNMYNFCIIKFSLKKYYIFADLNIIYKIFFKI